MNTSKKELEETLRTAARSLLLDHGTSVKDILNVIRSEAMRASTGLPPRHVFYKSGYYHFDLSPVAAHLLWTKKKDKSFPNVNENRDSRYPRYIGLSDLKNRDDQDLFQVIHDIADHFVYEKTKEGNLVIGNRFKEYYIAEVLQTDDGNSAPLNERENRPAQAHRKRRRNDPIPPFAQSKKEDLPSVQRKIVSELRHNNEKHKKYPERGSKELKITTENPDRHALFEEIRPFFWTVREKYNRAVFRQAWKLGCVAEAFPRIHDLVPYLKKGGKWPDRVEDLEHPGDVQRAKLQIGLKGAGFKGDGEPVLAMKEVPALADWELSEYEGREEVHIDLTLKDFTLDGRVGMET
ncbi:hypothetical protein HK104_004160 [Borealophlyctis nickersoniae]|nr:hypothetical protein HK104_004160 [Borealophlyctis nickersoniae]